MLKISITTELIGFSISGNYHKGLSMVSGYFSVPDNMYILSLKLVTIYV